MPHKKAPVNNKAGHEDSGIICSHQTFSRFLGFHVCFVCFSPKPRSRGCDSGCSECLTLTIIGAGTQSSSLEPLITKQLANLPDLHCQETPGSALRISWDFGNNGWNINSRARTGGWHEGRCPRRTRDSLAFSPSPRCPHCRDRHPGVLLALLEVVNVTGFFFHQEFKTQNKTSAVKWINLKERKWSLLVASDSVTQWTVAHQTPLSMGFFR